MHVEVNEISPVLVEVKVQVPWARVHQALEERFVRLSKTARVKGFRPGKVPLAMVKNLFKKQVEAEATGTLLEEGLGKAVDEHSLMLASQPEVNPPAIAQGDDFTFVAKCEVRPKVDKVVLEGITVFRDLDPVTDKEVDDEIERLRNTHSDVQVPEPMRPAKESDVLNVDYTVSIDGEDKPDLAATDRTVELGGQRLLPEFEKALIGAQPGETHPANVTYGDDFGNVELRGKTATFSITVKDLKEKLLPAVDDDFAKDCGDYTSLADLRAKLRENLEQAATRRSDASMKDQLIEAVTEKNPIEVPPSLVKQQRQSLAYEMFQISQMLGAPPPADAFADLDHRAERRVRAGLVLSAIAKLEKLDVTEADVQVKLEELAKQSGKHVAKLRAEYTGENRERLESQLLEAKILDFVRAKVTIADGKRPETKKES